MSKIHVVIWSGGMDSTLVLDKVCSANDDSCIWAFTVTWDMLNERKIKREKVARKNYLSYAKKKFSCDIAHRTIKVGANCGAPDLGMAQCLAWFSNVLVYLPKKSRLYTGYHSGDDFWKHHEQVKDYVKAGAAIGGGREIELQFPLQFMSKCEILNDYTSRQIPMDCFWTCENPSSSLVAGQCGRCRPCISLKTAQYESKLMKGMR